MNLRTETEKMLSGEPYDVLDPALVAERYRVRALCRKINSTSDWDGDLRRHLCKQIFGKGGDTVSIQPPFFCDYGSNIELGVQVFFNFNCIVLDACRVRIGDYVLFGPGVQILTPMHPLDAALRRKQLYGKPVEIGSDVWVGGGAIIQPGVTIGSGTVIGAGSVVTRDIPAGVFAAGNPCRVVREISLDERETDSTARD
ncbi:sugar O-acetyltransferase [Mesorhizobium sp. 128a]